MKNALEVQQVSPLQQAGIAIQRLQQKLSEAQTKLNEPIAIIGMGCRFPGNANTPTKFWELLEKGEDLLQPIPAERWANNEYYDPTIGIKGKSYVSHGYFLRNVDLFDADFFGISPKEALSLDPQHRLLLEVAWEALENASIAPDSLKDTATGVYVGLMNHDYRTLLNKSRRLDEINIYHGLGNGSFSASGRLAYFLGLQGACMTIDTACSSSLVALHLACQNLRMHETNLAMVGSANLMLDAEVMISMSQGRMLAPDGRCKTFDKLANGYGRGEGCGVVILKRLSDAIVAKDHILAVVRGSAVNQDGASSGLTVPNGEAQKKLLENALATYQIDADDIDYIEAHGTGTYLGDPIEINAITAAIANKRKIAKHLIIGSVKTNIGHLEPASGIAGLIKIVLALQHQKIPPHLNFNELNPNINFNHNTYQVPQEVIPWIKLDKKKRLASLNSFGISGTNACALIEEAPSVPNNLLSQRPYRILALSARSQTALEQLASTYLQYLIEQPNLNLDDFTYTANAGRKHFEYRTAILFQSKEDLINQLKNKIYSINQVNLQQIKKIAIVFMEHEQLDFGITKLLYEAEHIFKSALDQCATLLKELAKIPLLEILFDEEYAEQRSQPSYSRLAIFCYDYALFKLWQSWGIQPECVLGHGFGEYLAMVAAEIITLPDALKLVIGYADILHSSALLKSVSEKLLQEFCSIAENIEYQPAQLKLISCTTGNSIDHNAIDNSYWAMHLKQVKSVKPDTFFFEKAGCDIFLEIGSQPTLINKERNVAVEVTHGWGKLYNTVAQLYCKGVAINWQHLEQPYAQRKLIIPNYPFERKPYWFELRSVLREYVIPADINKHPLLRTPFFSPNIEDIIFTSKLTEKWPGFIQQHKIQGNIIIAGAVYLSTILSLIQEKFKQNYSISNIEFLQMCTITSNQTRIMQIIVKKHQTDTLKVSIISCDTNRYTDNKWITHCVADLVPADKKTNTTLSNFVAVEEIKNTAAIIYSGKTVDDGLQSLGYETGTNFQWIEQVYVNKNMIIGKMRLPQLASEEASYLLYPGFIDSCFQLFSCNPNNAVAYVPFIIGKFNYDVFSENKPVWVHAIIKDASSLKANYTSGDIFIYDHTGQQLGSLENIIWKPLPVLRQGDAVESPWKNWLYETNWLERLLDKQNSNAVKQSQCFLIFAGENGFSEMVINAFQKQANDYLVVYKGEACQEVENNLFKVNPQNKSDICNLLQNILQKKKITNIIYLWPVDNVVYPEEKDISAESLWSQQRELIFELLNLLQALLTLNVSVLESFVVVTCSAQLLTNHIPNLVQAPLLGFFKTLNMEHAELNCKLIDLDHTASTDRNSEQLIQEINDNNNESQISFRNYKRYVARLTRYKIVNNESSINQLSDGAYLITGGLGGVGLKTAEWLAEKGAKHLVLVGRHLPNDHAQLIIQKLIEQRAAVTVVQLNIGNQGLVFDLLSRFGKDLPPLKGVIHAAGVLDDKTILQTDINRFTKVFIPKVLGAWNLHVSTQLTQQKLDFFVLFSSLASSLGSPGQSNYSAANMFLDALAYYRQQHKLPALSLNFGPIAEIGMAARADQKWHEMMVNSMGVCYVRPSHALAAMEILLNEPIANATIADIDWEIFLRRPYRQSLFLDNFNIGANKKVSNGFKINVNDIINLSSEQRKDVLVKCLNGILCDILKYKEAQSIDCNKNFFDLGMDSLLGIEFNNEIKLLIGEEYQLPSSLTFEYSTLNSLADYLEKLILTSEIASDFLAQKTTWFKKVHSIADANIALICFPCAGGNPAMYTRWISSLPEKVNLLVLDLSKKNQLDTSDNAMDFSHLVNQLADEIIKHNKLPFIFLGHSMGSLIAFELSSELQRRDAVMPQQLFIMGFDTPQAIGYEIQKFATSSDYKQKRLQQMQQAAVPAEKTNNSNENNELQKKDYENDLNNNNNNQSLNTPAGITVQQDYTEAVGTESLFNAEFQQYYFSSLEADIKFICTYHYNRSEPLSCPIIIINGAQDQLVDTTQLMNWRDYTASEFKSYTLMGNHLSMVLDQMLIANTINIIFGNS